MDAPLTIRMSFGKGLFIAAASVGFIAVGILMLTLPGSQPWGAGAGRLLQPLVGLAAVLFGLVGLAALIIAGRRPLLRLYPDRIEEPRRRLTIPYGDVAAVTAEARGGLIDGKWLQLTLHDPARRTLTLDLSLATQADFEQARAVIAQRVEQPK